LKETIVKAVKLWMSRDAGVTLRQVYGVDEKVFDDDDSEVATD